MTRDAAVGSATTTLVVRDLSPTASVRVSGRVLVDVDAFDRPVRIVLTLGQRGVEQRDWNDLVAAFPGLRARLPTFGSLLRLAEAA